MTSKRFELDYGEILDDRSDIERQRAMPVSVESISDKQPLAVLESLIKMWPVHDIRYSGYGTLDDNVMIDMIKGAEVRVIRKDLMLGLLDLTVDFIKNLDEIERYNAAVKSHNRKWIDQGSPTEVFDPVHGDVHAIADQMVDPVFIQSSHYRLPKSVYGGISYGPLTKVRPEIERKSHVKVRYQMSITPDSRFILGYAAYDYEGRIIYYNEVVHHNLAYLVRRSIQEIWGNPVALNKFANLLEGVSMLIQGKKLSICKRDNKLPEFLRREGSVLKSTKPITQLELKEEVCTTTSNFTAYIGPALCIAGYIIAFGWMIAVIGGGSLTVTFSQVGEGGIGSLFYMLLEILIKPPVILCLICLSLTVYFRIATQKLDRKASELKAHGRLL